MWMWKLCECKTDENKKYECLYVCMFHSWTVREKIAIKAYFSTVVAPAAVVILAWG